MRIKLKDLLTDEIKNTLKKKSKGLGDTIDKITTVTQFKKLVKWINGDRDCGCGPRKEYLNKLFPYGKQD